MRQTLGAANGYGRKSIENIKQFDFVAKQKNTNKTKKNILKVLGKGGMAQTNKSIEKTKKNNIPEVLGLGGIGTKQKKKTIFQRSWGWGGPTKSFQILFFFCFDFFGFLNVFLISLHGVLPKETQSIFYDIITWRFILFFSRERLRRVLRKKAAVILHLHTFTSADLHLHTFTSADLLHTLTPADLDLHTLTSADLDLHTLTSADLHLHTLTSADLHLHTFTSADLDLHTLTSADLDLHTLTSADLDLHTLTSADLHLHTLTSADLLSLFFYSLLRRGRCRRSATKPNPFARNGRWTSKTEEKLRL